MQDARKLSIVVPVFNEQDAVAPFIRGLDAALASWQGARELIFVNDGSTDGTLERLLALRAQRPEVRVIDLSRNFGKDVAMTAGLDLATGDAVVPMDIDLQDPPELIPEFIRQWEAGYEVVYGVRRSRSGDTWWKRATARCFYRLFNLLTEHPIPVDAGDFRLLDRRVVAALRQMPERGRFMKGIFAWVGFRAIGVPYERPARSAGASRWDNWRLLQFALAAIFSFSVWPLRAWSVIGGLVGLASMVYGAWLVFRTIVFGVDVPGYASTIVAILFIGGLNLLGIGVVGEYLARIYREAKARPLYIVRRAYD